MNNRIVEVFEIRRGKTCVIINCFKFSEFRTNKESKFFRCTYRGYKITVKITQNLKFVISIHGEHNHEAL